ncbi:MAG: sulfatase-like hydrolase/transferase [Kiritimatiellae bacterium]|jgi:choline-sulfatase|nr:sulfatase-like hydrolase/transferase [Kiritimatiellia bacterium]
MKRPNILFLMSDEHRADITGFEGDKTVRTPVLDQLAETGVVFSNAYCASPICVPGRQCIAAGQLPRTCSCENYGDDLTPGYLTWPKTFSQYAYITTACGKLHHMGSDQLQGWRRRIGMDDMLIHDVKNIPGAHQEEFDRYQSNMTREGKWSDSKEIKKAGIGVGPHTEVRDEYATKGMENVISEYFVDPFYERTLEHFPHVLYLGLNNPHYPYFAQEDLFNYYLDKVPIYKDEPVFDHPWLGKSPFMPGAVKIGPDGDVTELEARKATAAYYANIEACDQRFGRVLESLKAAGEDIDDWIIIYTTDHGEMLGQHSIWEKQKFFEASARVPLIIRWPKGFKGGQVIKENVNLCDLFATLCDLCDIPIPSGLDSRSLVPLIKGDSDAWNNETISQFWGKFLMIKWGHLKYQYYGEDMPEVLFDLQRNPEETKNFIDDDEYAEIIKKFRKRCGELGFGPNADPNYTNAGY